jgi:serine/threonine protein kinase
MEYIHSTQGCNYLLKTRIKNTKEITNYFDITESDPCEQIDKVLGRGSFGQVLKCKVKIGNKNHFIAVKESPCINCKIPIEYFILKLINKLLIKRRCPNFFFTFATKFSPCYSITLSSRKKFTGSCSAIYSELASGVLPLDLNPDVQCSVLFQILSGLHALQYYYQIIHSDIKRSNILFYRTLPNHFIKNSLSSNKTYWEYEILENTYYIENMGYLVYISDFGLASSCSPLYSNYHGERNATIIGDTFIPFSSKFYASRDSKGEVILKNPIPFNWKEDWGFTRNKFYKNIDIEPDISHFSSNGISSIDFTNIIHMPPFDFFYDISAIVKMFLGDKRIMSKFNSQSNKHSKHIHFGFDKLDKDLEKLLYLKAYVNIDTYKWPFDDSTHLILASAMIKKLFNDISPSKGILFKRPKNILEKFTMKD